MATARSHTSYLGPLGPLVALVLIVGILYVAKTVIVPLALAVLLTFVLGPVVSAIQRRGPPRIVAVLFCVLCTFILFGLVGYIVVAEVQHLARELPKHRKDIEAKIASVRGAGGPISNVLQMFREISQGKTQAEAAAEAETRQVIVTQPEKPSSFEQLLQAVGPVLEPLAQTFVVIVLVIFMLINREDLRNRVIGLLGHGQLAGMTRIFVDSAQRVSRYLLTQLLINTGFGGLFAVGLFFIGVPYAFLWGSLAVLLRFVPYLGSWVAAAFPLLLAFAIGPTWTQPILVLALFLGLELVTANVVEPLLFGHGTGVSPMALLVAAAFWTWIWGPLGLVLSTPLTVCLVVLGQHVPRLHFLAVLLGDEPPLEPHVSYYQRLLARDRAEAKQVVVEYAKTKGQEHLYDDVFLPALTLARRDRKQAGLTAEDEASIFDATKELLDSPDPETVAAKTEANCSHVSPESPVEHGPEVLVLGCPAHHQAEELSLHMLARLLRPEGYRMEVASTRALPAELEAQIEKECPALVVLGILPPGGLEQARYLCKRLRKRFANLPIVVGYWGDERNYDRLLVHLRAVGASYVTTSLLQTRTQVRALAKPSPATCAPSSGEPHLPAAVPAGAESRN